MSSTSVRGKADRLRTHLDRVAVLGERLSSLQRYVRSSNAVTIEALLAFSTIVPMHFSQITARYGVRIVTLDELANI